LILVAASAEGITNDPNGLVLLAAEEVPGVEVFEGTLMIGSELGTCARTSRGQRIDGFVMSEYRSVVLKTATSFTTSFTHKLTSSAVNITIFFVLYVWPKTRRNFLRTLV
jgi:hypothetical protein